MPDITREELYQKFGPVLMEAVVLIIKDEINLIRSQIGLPARTDSQIMTAIDTKLNGLELYEWLKE